MWSSAEPTVKSAIRISLLTIVILLAAIAWPLVKSAVTRAQQRDQSTPTLDMTAKKHEFDPSMAHSKADTKIGLKITATDRSHGFAISTVAEGSPEDTAPALVLG
jgi:hypothetical protein